MRKLRSGEQPVIIESSKFNKEDFLKFFGIWRQKNTEEINIFKDILEERKKFNRGEIKL